MDRSRTLRIAAVTVVGAAVLTVAAYRLLPSLSPAGERAPEINVQRLDGRLVSLSEMRGQVVLLNFWATWCPPCRLEMPGFEQVYEARKDDGFTVLGLSTDYQLSDDQIRWFLEQRGITYPVARATGLASQAYGNVETLPTSFLIDAKGRIRRTVTGAFDQAELVAVVDSLLREAGREPTGQVAMVRRGAPSWLDLKGVGQVIGSDAAPVSVVEFSDYGCTYCRRFSTEIFPRLYSEFMETGKVRWVHLPFILGKFPNAEEASAAGICAAEQGNDIFWPVHMKLFVRQAEWRAAADPLPVFLSYLEASDGDRAAFESCYHSNRPGTILARVEQLASAAGVAATPTFFVNGQLVQGAVPLAEFRQILEQASSE